MLSDDFAKQFAADWVNAWNAHDLDAILSHYVDDFEMTSPVMVQMNVSQTGHLQGKHAIRAYWQKALQLIPDLQFELISVLKGVQSITLYYKGARGRLAAEVFFFNSAGKVTHALAHYEG
jgi:hypothetical protein